MTFTGNKNENFFCILCDLHYLCIRYGKSAAAKSTKV